MHIEMQQWVLCVDSVNLGWRWRGCALCSKPSVDTSFKTLLSAVEGNQLAIWKVDTVVDIGGASRFDVFGCKGT